MGRLFLAIFILTASLALPPATGTSGEHCETVSPEVLVHLGGSYLRRYAERCYYTNPVNGDLFTQRTDRTDYITADPSRPNGLHHVVTFMEQSILIKHVNGAESLSHLLLVSVEGETVTMKYADHTATNGVTSCDAAIGTTRGVSYRSQLLPVCWPKGFLLP